MKAKHIKLYMFSFQTILLSAINYISPPIYKSLCLSHCKNCVDKICVNKKQPYSELDKLSIQINDRLLVQNEDLVEILEGKTSTDIGKHVPIKRGIKFCFMWLSTSRICRGRILHAFIICDQGRGHREKSETIVTLYNNVTFQYSLSGVSRRITKQQNHTTY